MVENGLWKDILPPKTFRRILYTTATLAIIQAGILEANLLRNQDTSLKIDKLIANSLTGVVPSPNEQAVAYVINFPNTQSGHWNVLEISDLKGNVKYSFPIESDYLLWKNIQWSPDSKKVVFGVGSIETNDWDLYVYTLGKKAVITSPLTKIPSGFSYVKWINNDDIYVEFSSGGSLVTRP